MSFGLVNREVLRLRGEFVLNGATPVTVEAPGVNSGAMILISISAPGGTVGAVPAVQSIDEVAQSFDIAGTAGDTSTYNFIVLA